MLSDLTKPFLLAATIGPIDGLEATPMALCPNKPLVAGIASSSSGCEIVVVDYQGGGIVGKALLRNKPEQILFSPSGQRIFLCNLDGSCEVLRGPWSHPSCLQCRLNNLADATWMDEAKLLTVGPKTTLLKGEEHGVVWVAEVDADRGETRSMCREQILTEIEKDKSIADVRCSADGRVALLYGDLDKTNLLSFTYSDGSLSATARAELPGCVFWTAVALLDKGEMLLWNSDRCEGGIRLFASDGMLLHEGSCPSAGYTRAHILSEGDVVLLTTFSIGREKDRWLAWVWKSDHGQLSRWYAGETEKAPGALGVLAGEHHLASQTGNEIAVYRLNHPDIVQLSGPNSDEAVQAVARISASRMMAARVAVETVVVERRGEDEKELREAAVGALATLGDPASLDFLILQLGRRHPLVDRDKLLKAIEAFDVTSRQEAAVRALATDSVAYYGAIRALEHIPTVKALDRLCGALSDQDDEIRVSAAKGLATLADLRAVIALLSRLNEENEQVRQAVWSALMEVLRVGGLLPEKLKQRVGEPVDLVSFAQKVIEDGQVGEFARSGEVAADLLDVLAGALVNNNLPFENVLGAIEALTQTRGDFSQRTLIAAGLVVALAMADSLQRRNRSDLSEMLYRHAVSLAAQADVPQIAWRCWGAIGCCRQRLGDVRGAAAAYAHAMGFIDRLWFALLDEKRLRGFFQDKAQLYDRAALCALRLGHQSVSLETIERAKTRYLGDLIARRRLQPRGEFEKEVEEFWKAVDLNKPERLPVVSTRLGPRERVALVDVKAGGDSGSAPRFRPDKLRAFEEQVQEPDFELGFLQQVWMSATWTKSLDDREKRGEIVQHLQKIYDALAAVRDAMARREWPLAAEQRDSVLASYDSGALGACDLDYKKLWIFREYKHSIAGLIKGPADTKQVAFLDAVLEALDFVLARETVFAVPAASGEESLPRMPDGIAFVAQALKTPDTITAADRSLAVDRAVARHIRGSWRHVARLARGEISGFAEALSGLTGPDCALLQFALTEGGTAIFICYGASGRENAAADGRQESIEGRFETLLLPEVNITAVTRLMVEGSESWFGCYRLLDQDYNRLNKWKNKVDETLFWLSKALWAPIDERLQAHGIQHLRLIPHRALHLVPFAALWRNKRYWGREHLVDAYEISYAPSLTLAEICRNRAKRGRGEKATLTLVSDPEGNLPFAWTEGESIAALFDSTSRTIFRGADATLANIAKSSATKILHFAGHGRYEWQDPLQSQLRLSDTQLTLDRLFADDLHMEDAGLVVLSGCETNMTDPADLADEWLGLAAGFLFAGARQTISTLWAVDDLSSGMLLSTFYHYLLGERLSVTRSLQMAQCWLRDKGSRREAICFAEKAISALQERLEARDERASSLEKYVREIEKRITRLRRGPPNPFREAFYWAAFTVSGFEELSPSGR